MSWAPGHTRRGLFLRRYLTAYKRHFPTASGPGSSQTGKKQLSSIFLTLTLSSLWPLRGPEAYQVQLGRLNEHQESTCLRLLGAGITDTHHSTHPALCMDVWLRPQPSRHTGKHFTRVTSEQFYRRQSHRGSRPSRSPRASPGPRLWQATAHSPRARSRIAASSRQEARRRLGAARMVPRS